MADVDMSDAKAVSKGESSEPAKKPRFEVKKVCLSLSLLEREIYDHAQLCGASDQVCRLGIWALTCYG